MKFVHLEKINNRYRGPFEETKYALTFNSFASAISYLYRKFENIKLSIYKMNSHSSININVDKYVDNIYDSINNADIEIYNIIDQIL